MYKKIISRAVKIMLLGWFLRLWPEFSFEVMRFTGVLPRISIVFLVCALIFLNTNWKQQVWIGSLTLAGYWLLMILVPVPIDEVIQNALISGQVQYNGGMLDIGPLQKISESTIAANYEPGVNIVSWLDRIIVPGRFWQVTWDPEGIMSTFPAIVSGIIGMLVGRIILAFENPYKRLTWVFFIGFSLYLMGEAWGWFMPFNKNLWSSSYTLWTAGVCTMGLAAAILVVDVLGYIKWTKIGRVYGANAITSYVLAGMLTLVFYSDIFGGYALNGFWMDGMTGAGMDPRLASFIYAILYMLVIYIPAYILYKKKIFIKV
jgi:predicted acyltransferase